MGSEWKEMIWGDLATLEYGKGLRGYQEATGPYRVYGTNGPIGWHDEPLCPFPSVIVGRKGAYRGIHFSPEPFFVIDTAFYLNPKEDFDMKWAYYELLTHDINSMDSGSAIPSTSRQSFYALHVLVPPLPEQRAIAHILGTLDDKIELNRRMNATLEAMARALFQSWFVDFDPVWENIKRHGPGHPLAGQAAAHPGAPSLPDHILALFPDGFEESALGLIPQGWRVKTIKECCIKIQNGGTPRRSEPAYWQAATIPWLTSGEVRQNLIIDTENRISEAGLIKSSAKWLPSDSTVVALYGATAGQVAFIASKMTTNQAVCGLIPKESHRYFNYLALAASVAKLANLARGSAQQNISKGIVESLKIVVPDIILFKLFDKECEPLFSRWIHNLYESRTLAGLRDTLLPRLISGELRVEDAERFLAEAGV